VYENAGRKELGMKKSLCGLFVAGLVLAFATALAAGTLENQGMAWLAAQTEPAAINVSGTWSSEFGELRLDQAAASRDVSGSGGGYELIGVVSGKRLFLLFDTKRGTLDYCAVLDSEGDNSLSGNYYDRNTFINGRAFSTPCRVKSRKINMRRR
jgi:hypothetical protein